MIKGILEHKSLREREDSISWWKEYQDGDGRTKIRIINGSRSLADYQEDWNIAKREVQQAFPARFSQNKGESPEGAKR